MAVLQGKAFDAFKEIESKANERFIPQVPLVGSTASNRVETVRRDEQVSDIQQSSCGPEVSTDDRGIGYRCSNNRYMDHSLKVLFLPVGWSILE